MAFSQMPAILFFLFMISKFSELATNLHIFSLLHFLFSGIKVMPNLILSPYFSPTFQSHLSHDIDPLELANDQLLTEFLNAITMQPLDVGLLLYTLKKSSSQISLLICLEVDCFRIIINKMNSFLSPILQISRSNNKILIQFSFTEMYSKNAYI